MIRYMITSTKSICQFPSFVEVPAFTVEYIDLNGEPTAQAFEELRKRYEKDGLQIIAFSRIGEVNDSTDIR